MTDKISDYVDYEVTRAPETGRFAINSTEITGEKLAADDAIIKATTKNTSVVETLVKNYPVDNPQDMDARFLRAVHSSQTSVFLPTNWLLGKQETASLQETKAAFERLVDALPPFPSSDETKALFTPNENGAASGFAPLDNPRLWYDKSIEDFKAIPLSKELLEKRTQKGSSLLNSAFFGFRPKEVVAHLNQQGLHLRSDILLTAEGKPSALLEQLIDNNAVSAVFTPDNWLGASKQELYRVHQALPESQRSKVGINGLLQQISTSNQARGR